MYLFRLAVWTLSATTLLAATVQGATRTVCASGCMYTNLQPAIDAAQPGDTILLRAGETFIGNYILRAKSGTTEIIIRSDAAGIERAGVRRPSRALGTHRRQHRAVFACAPARPGRHLEAARRSSGPRAARTTTGCSSSRSTARTRKGYETLIALGNNTTQTSTGARALRDHARSPVHPRRPRARSEAVPGARQRFDQHPQQLLRRLQALRERRPGHRGLQRSRPVPDRQQLPRRIHREHPLRRIGSEDPEPRAERHHHHAQHGHEAARLA